MSRIDLLDPLDIAGERVDALEIREPKAGDIRALGDPVTYVSNGSSVSPLFDNDVVASYLGRLAQVPPSTIDKMSARDFLKARGVLLAFFALQG